jgi:hypothetical protein
MGSNGYMMVDGTQVHKVERVSQSKSGNVWIYSTNCTGYTWSPLTLSTTLSALATRGAHSPSLPHCLHWLHLEPTHPLYHTVCTGYTWSPLTGLIATLFSWLNVPTVYEYSV